VIKTTITDTKYQGEDYMKKVIIFLHLALILCFMVGCQDKEAMAELEAFKAQAEVEEQNKALVMRVEEAWKKGDIEAAKKFLSPDYVGHISGKDVSLEDTIEALKQKIAMFPDSTSSAEDIIAKGDKVIVRSITRATYEGDVEGFPATGSKIEIEGIEIVRVEDGKIVESWAEFDSLGLMMQLGYELKPKEGEK
jgi:steroid delta-isomerase-like uncharacterized protein